VKVFLHSKWENTTAKKKADSILDSKEERKIKLVGYTQREFSNIFKHSMETIQKSTLDLQQYITFTRKTGERKKKKDQMGKKKKKKCYSGLTLLSGGK
jgi:uncharacterized protein Yka (UPF0111/DUF47 family)